MPECESLSTDRSNRDGFHDGCDDDDTAHSNDSTCDIERDRGRVRSLPQEPAGLRASLCTAPPFGVVPGSRWPQQCIRHRTGRVGR